MPRYLVERSFGVGSEIPFATRTDAETREVALRNADCGVTWIQSFITEDRTHSFCIYHGPSPEAIRRSAAQEQLPIDRIVEVRVLEPYRYG
jgi:Protein of unknown function (DUF4242)